MKVRIGAEATEEEASAIASALAQHVGSEVNVYVGDADEPTVTWSETEEPIEDDLGPTEREEKLWEEIEEIKAGGPEKYKERLAEKGKLFVRDRLDLWFGDDGLKFEDGRFAEFDAEDKLPADGLLTGAAEFEGRDVHFMANDFTVKAGSMAAKGVEKFLRMQQRALQSGNPVLYLMDSSGGRIDQQTGFFANREGIGKYYYNHSMLSGRVPQICVLYGPCIAGAAYTPMFADFTIMVEGMSAMAIASPRMVKMVTGEDISMQDLGGAQMHAEHSGSADLVARNEEHARELVSDLITYLPNKAHEKPPRSEPRAPKLSPNGIDEVIPQSPNRAYDMTDVIERVVDAGSYFELRPDFGKEIITAFAKIDGRPVGIVANQPAQRSGAIFPDAAEKAAEFIWKCDAFEVPLLYLCDTPGFMAGSQVEKDAILEKGKKMIYATSSATVPKQSVVVRKAYGAGIYAMSGPAYDPQSVIALPSGEIGIMGPEAAINAVYANKLNAIEDEEERAQREQELREEYREDIDAHRMASEMVIDDIVPPSTLREELVNRFEFYADMEKSLPDKKHGTIL
ncbi:Acetyl-CoA carboxylase, carboxyltransferase component [Haladaptatus litoreus]|uniref:Acetyl-CoA carboxylase, carboxyltransferase component n=1 Tax=Haladaptatus litoreus TaxID=553468 RepID=A0A1N6YG59_9EURY|nr:acyl-CoA carboxylase subunit beta [Haladaptatus litoreus]SIR13622.1 Acetyl-CoA carboxylase, carboxyltransferase component [Haladaptatus litoreus]